MFLAGYVNTSLYMATRMQPTQAKPYMMNARGFLVDALTDEKFPEKKPRLIQIAGRPPSRSLAPIYLHSPSYSF